MVFDGKNHNAEDGTVVVVGDLGEEFGADNLLFRTARGLAEVEHKETLRKQLAALDARVPETAVALPDGQRSRPTKRDAI